MESSRLTGGTKPREKKEAMNNSSEAIQDECLVYILWGGKMKNPSLGAQVVFVVNIIINVFTFPFTAFLNALVMFAVKTKRRLRAHKSHIIIALLATTDFTVGILIQPATVAWLVVILINYKTEICPFFFLRLLMDSLLDVSLAHVAMISLERYIAVKHPFAYTFVITETKLLIASAVAWTFSLIIHILWYYTFTVYMSVFLSITNAFKCFCIVVIVWCNVIVYRETLRHKQQIANHQVTQEIREKILKDKKAFKVTTRIVIVLFLCYLPTIISRMILEKYIPENGISLDTTCIVIFSYSSVILLNSVINPILYSIKIREFRVAFIEILCKTANLAKAEEIEMRFFKSPNVVARLQAEHAQGAEELNWSSQETEQPIGN